MLTKKPRDCTATAYNNNGIALFPEAILDVQSQFEFWYPIQILYSSFMPSNKQKTNKRRGGRARLTDVPKPTAHTYNTISCRLPRLTNSCSVRTSFDDLVTATSGSVVTRGFAFTLNQMNIGSGFFDRYRIDAIRFNVVPRNNAIGLTAGLVDLFFVIDYDNVSALSSTSQAQAYATCLKLAPGESASRTFAPNLAIASYTGTIFSGFANQKPQWIDAGSASVQHYGVKLYVPATGLVGQTVFQQWDINVECFLSFCQSIG